MTKAQIQEMISKGWRVVNLRPCVAPVTPTRPIQIWMKLLNNPQTSEIT